MFRSFRYFLTPLSRNIDGSTMKWESQMFSSPGERAGLALVATAGLASTLFTGGLAIYVVWHVFMARVTRSSPLPRGVQAFARSSLGCYLISLLCCDFCQGVAFAMNYRWAVVGYMSPGTLCAVQGAVSELGDLGAAIWSMAIALHTFWLLFLVRKPHRLVAPTVFVAGWALLIILPIIGPSVIEDTERGPFYNLSGAWCWIGEKYAAERVIYLYGWIFAALASSIVSYTLIYLRFSHIITLESDGKLKVNFRRPKMNSTTGTCESQSRVSTSRYTTPSLSGCFGWMKDTHDITGVLSGTGASSDQLSDNSNPHVNDHLKRIARRLMWYPILYAIVVLPASVCRMGVLGGWEPPFGLFIFAGVCFGSSGVTNSILFIMTRHSFMKEVATTTNTTRVHITTQRITVHEDSTTKEQEVELGEMKLKEGSSAMTKSAEYCPDVDPPACGDKNRVSIMHNGIFGRRDMKEEGDKAGFHVTILGKH